MTVCREGQWLKENWRYSSHERAMWSAYRQMELSADAVVVEQIEWREQRIIDNSPGATPFDFHTDYNVWNFKQRDYFKGVRVRERHRKKHKQE